MEYCRHDSRAEVKSDPCSITQLFQEVRRDLQKQLKSKLTSLLQYFPYGEGPRDLYRQRVKCFGCKDQVRASPKKPKKAVTTLKANLRLL